MRSVLSLPDSPHYGRTRTSRLEIGSRVLAKTRDEEWREGTIRKVRNADDSFDIEFDAGRSEKHVSRRRIKMMDSEDEEEDRVPSDFPVELSDLESAAFDAMKLQSVSINGVRYGAALVTKDGGKIYRAHAVETKDGKIKCSAEQTVLLKALSDESKSFKAMLICSDQTMGLPMPNRDARETMSQFGSFEVYVMNAQKKYQIFRTGDLAIRKDDNDTKNLALVRTSRGGHNVRSWSIKDVSHWLRNEVKLAQHIEAFQESDVDGLMLLKITEDDMKGILNVSNKLHRRKLLDAIQVLREKDLLEYGLENGQIESCVLFFYLQLIASFIHSKIALKYCFKENLLNSSSALKAQSTLSLSLSLFAPEHHART